MVNRDRGTEIATLRAELRKLPGDARVLAEGDRFNELQRLLDQRFALLRMTQARRVALVKEKAWALSEVEGYERGLVLAGGAGRLRQRLEERASVADQITAEVEEVDRKIASIEAEILVERLPNAVEDRGIGSAGTNLREISLECLLRFANRLIELFECFSKHGFPRLAGVSPPRPLGYRRLRP